MCKRAMFMLLSLMTFPSFASAATYWQITATTSPTALKTNLTAARPANFGNYTTPGGAAMSLTKVTRTPYNNVSFDVADIPGKTVIVKVDGVQVGAVPGTYTIAKGTLLSHNIAAYYSTATSYTLTSQPEVGGTISPSATYSANGAVVVTPFVGYTLAGLKIGPTIYDLAATLPAGVTMAGDLNGATYTFASGSYTVQGVFVAVPTADAIITTPNMSIQNGTVITIDGSPSSSNVSGATYEWSTSCGTIVPTALNAKTAVYTAPAIADTCTVTLAVNTTVLAPATASVMIINYKYDPSATCIDCHNGTNGPSSAGYLKSSHRSNDATTSDAASCQNCHNPNNDLSHAYMSSYNVCSSCHGNVTAYAPHVQTGEPVNGFYTEASYILPTSSVSATCADCHSHNNTINAGWAEGGHGSLTAVPWKSDSSHIWLDQGPAAAGVNFQNSPQQTNCIRCHSAQGFIQFVDSGFTKIDRIKNAGASIKDSSPLTCNGCHTSPEGALRGNFGSGYKAFWGYSNALISGKKVVTSIQLGNNKNSNICMPCHSQRASGQEIKDIFATGSFKQYSAGSAIYPHAAQPSAIFYGKGGYEFTATTNPASGTGDFDYQDRARHQRIGNYGTGTGYNNTGVTQGSCVACHMASDKTHSLEINAASFTNTCSKCHPSNFVESDVLSAKANFDAAVKALGNLLVAKGITIDGINPLPERKAKDMSLGFVGTVAQKNVIAERNMGAWFNWYLFNTADKGAFAHNPSYARRLITDSIDALDDGILNNSAAGTILAQQVAGKLDNIQGPAAVSFSQDPGCMGCHFGNTTNNLAGEAIPGILKAPHFNTDGALVPGQTFTQAQLVVPGAQCNNCHGFGHGTDSPGGTIIKDYAESNHGSINGMAWTDYDFKTRQGCVQCHTTTGFVKNVGATFAAGVVAPSIDVVGTATDTTKQVLGCNACHSSTAWKTSVRNGGAVTAPMGVSGNTPKAVIAFADVGESNVCILCHSSRENGESLIAGNPTNTATKGFANPHYLGAAAVFYGKGGFQFYTSGVRYNTYGAAGKTGKNANWSHGKLGMDNYSGSGSNDLAGKSNNTGTKGQCVACHLGPNNTHTFGAAEVANATMAGSTSTTQTSVANGGTNAVLPITRTCYGCHKGNAESKAVTIEAFIDEEKEIWNRMFDFFKWQLEQYSITYTDAYPYFAGSFGATVGTTFGGPGVVDNNKTRGAAMNLKLLLAEKGSHVHNRAFGRALIADSITYLQKGDVGDRSTVYPDQNQVIKFSDYSAARPTSYLGQVGPDISITTLKSYLTRSATGGYIRR